MTHLRTRIAILVLCGLALVVHTATAQGRSTLTARFVAPVAGPDVEQTAQLVLGFFPADGEAILGASVRFDDGLEVLSVASSRGRAHLDGRSAHLDFTEAPVGERVSDTLTVVLRTSRRGSLPVAVQLRSNTDRDPNAAYVTQVHLETQAPMGVRVSADLERLYPGEAVDVTLTVTNEDAAGRRLEGLGVNWPAPVTTEPGKVHLGPIEAGALARQRWPLRLAPNTRGTLAVTLSARGGGLLASPLAPVAFTVAAVPGFEAVLPDGGTAIRQQATEIRLRWTNRSPDPIAYEALRASIGGGFAAVEISGRAAGSRLEADAETGSVTVRVRGPGELAPGAAHVVVLTATPTGAGPFAWSAGFQPPDRESWLPLRGAVVHVLAPEGDTPGRAPVTATDLELASQGLRSAMHTALAGVPLARAASVSLAADQKDDANWVVEGLLNELLLQREVRVLADSAAAHTLHYRVADARVVYHPSSSGWKPLASGQRRDARVEVLLRLEDDRQHILWANRVVGRSEDPATNNAAKWLGGAKGITQAVVEADHRTVEFGLSGIIMGGLFFVFFAP